MAGIQAVAAVTQAVASILEMASNELSPRPDVRAYRTQDFLTPPPGAANQVSVYLYRISVNGNLRALPSRLDATGRRFRPSLPLDLHYMVTAWSTDVARQQTLLTWAMRALEDHPIIPPSLLASGTDRPFRPEETVDLIAAPVSQAEMVAIWEINKPAMQPSMIYIARMVSIDSNLELPDDLPIRSRALQTGQTP